MNLNRSCRRLVRLALLSLLLTILCGCEQTVTRTQRLGMDWSRGQKLGVTELSDRPALAVTGDGKQMGVAWVAKPPLNEPRRMRYAHINDQGELVHELDLDISVQSPIHIELGATSDNNWYLLWIDRLRDGHQLFFTMLDRAGNVLVEPVRISPVGLSVSSYATLVSTDGSLQVFWGGDGPLAPQLYHARIGSNGQITSTSEALEQPGMRPAINIDQEGMIHLVWLDEPDFGEFKVHYALFDPVERTLGQPTMLSAFPVPLGMVAHRPDIALVGNSAIVFWSLERRGGGMNPPSARTLYVMFPLSHPEAVTTPVELIVPDENHPAYARTETLLGIDELAIDQVGSPSSFVYMPAVVQGQQDEGAVVFSVQLRGRTKRWIQPIVTIWHEGAQEDVFQGYQVAAQTRTTSIRNRIVRDDQNNLYSVWIDTAGFGAYDVYYASTAPGMRQSLNRLTGWDVLSGFYDVLWGIAQAAGFFPLAVAWSLLSVMIIAAYLFWKAQGRLDHQGARLVLIIALAAYILSKYAFRPNWVAALPLPRYMPEFLAALVTYLTPLAISALAALITWAYTHRVHRAAILAAFGIFVASDALLTLLIYVPAMLIE